MVGTRDTLSPSQRKSLFDHVSSWYAQRGIFRTFLTMAGGLALLLGSREVNGAPEQELLETILATQEIPVLTEEFEMLQDSVPCDARASLYAHRVKTSKNNLQEVTYFFSEAFHGDTIGPYTSVDARRIADWTENAILSARMDLTLLREDLQKSATVEELQERATLLGFTDHETYESLWLAFDHCRPYDARVALERAIEDPHPD